MAISPDLPGLTLSIRVRDRKLPEYRDADIEDPPRVISYMIEAIPDSIFSIHAHASPDAKFTGSSLALYFYVDGKYVDGALIDSAESAFGYEASAKSQGRYVRDNMLRKYQFASRERQIELVETVSTSLSSRKRTSNKSSETPSVSYSGYEGRTPNTTTSSTVGRAFNLPPASFGESYRSATPAEHYHSVAYDVHPAAHTILPSRPARAKPVLEVPDIEDEDDMSSNEASGLEGKTDGRLESTFDPRAPQTIKLAPRPKYTPLKMQSIPRMTDIPEDACLPPSKPAVVTPHQSFITTPVTSKKELESATAGSDFTAPEELGTIKIVVTHVNKKGAIAFGRNASTTAEIGRAAQEAAKEKSGGLLVRFTAPQTVAPVQTWDVGAVNESDEDTSVTYLYHYRTREMLEALEVVPMEVKEERVRRPGVLDTRSEMDQSGQVAHGLYRSKRKMSEMDDELIEEGQNDGEVMQEGQRIEQERDMSKKSGTDDDWEMVDGDDA